MTQEQEAPSSSDKKGRPIFVFDVPPELAKEIGIKEIGVVELDVEEWKMAAARAGSSPIILAMELPLQSFRWADGRISLGDASADRVWKRLGPKGRDLVVAAYGNVNGNSTEDMKGFMASRRVVVG